jgi:adenylate cyclase
MATTGQSKIKLYNSKRKIVGPVRRYQAKSIVVIAISWTLLDFLYFIQRMLAGTLPAKYSSPVYNYSKEVLLREINVFLISLVIGYFIVAVLKNYLRNTSLVYNLLFKTLILIFAAFIMNFFIYVSYQWLIAGKSFEQGLSLFAYNMFHTKWLVQKMSEWVLLFILTLLAMEVNEKYSTGVFLSIMMGRYLQPREENRIIMFLDLTDSTPIAEKLGHKEYFKFIRDFIFFVSEGMITHEGRIYQYVGDEIVIWWPATPRNAKKAIASLLTARKELNKHAELFRRSYGILPDYKAGLHAGMVTVGQVGLIKKDVVMSGDAINTAARIRSACTELNQKYLASKTMVELLEMEEWQAESMGLVDLKGKNLDMELFTLKI